MSGDHPNLNEITLPLHSMNIFVNIIDGIAEVTISQTFLTGNSDGLYESHYQHPVDPSAAVTKFAAVVDDRVIQAIVKEKNEARLDYQTALEAGDRAYLGEQQRRDIFRISVGNLPLNQLVYIEFVYVTPLEAADEDVTFFLPTGISRRTEPLDMGQDIFQYHSGFIDDGVRIEMNVTMASPIVNVMSPSHSIDITSKSDSTTSGFSSVVVTGEDPLVRDLVIRIKTQKTYTPKLYIEHSKLHSSTAMLLSFVPSIADADTVRKREFIFVVDRSFSMEGNKIVQTRKALLRIIESLPEESVFNIVGFGGTYTTLFHESQNVSSIDDTALKNSINGIKADLGGTDILSPLEEIYSNTTMEGFYRQIFVFTDGKVCNTDETIEFVKNFNSTNNRIFSLGIGAHASRLLVQGIARSGRGTAEFVEGDDDKSIYDAVERQMAVALSPVFDDVEIGWGVLGTQAPYLSPPLLKGKRYITYFLTDVLLSSELSVGISSVHMNATVRMNVTNFASGEKHKLGVRVEDIIIMRDGDMIHKMAAQAMINDLEDGGSKMNLDEDFNNEVIVKEIVEIGVKYQLSSSETSFVAIDNYNWTTTQTQTNNNVGAIGIVGGLPIIHSHRQSNAHGRQEKYTLSFLCIISYLLW